MRLFLPLSFTIISSIPVFSQNFVGQWKGQFIDKSISTGDWGGDKCDYVLELENAGNELVKGYSYTYFTENGKKYYTICSLQGKIDQKQKSLEIKEITRTKTNVPSNIRNCFQLHKLTYFKKGDEETLSGEWIPAPNQEADCGFGLTKLTRRTLDREGFTKGANNSNRTETKKTVKPGNQSSPSNSNAASTTATAKKNITASAAPVSTAKLDKNNSTPVNNDQPAEAPRMNTLTNPDVTSAGYSFEKRTSNVIKTIETEKKIIRVDIFDNGEVDGDSVSLFFNGDLIVANKRLTEKAITFNLTLQDDHNANDLEMYAENLGSIPPNTAVMIVTDGTKRHELRVTSDLKKNGVIRFIHRN